MKKYLALALALITLMSCLLVACKKEGNPDDTDPIDMPFLGGGTTTTTGNGSTPEAWTEAEGTVYVLSNALNVRSSADMGNNIVGQAKYKDEFQRVKYNSTWTVIKYKDQECYISTKYVTTDKGSIEITPEDPAKTMYVNTDYMNLRNTPLYFNGYDANVEGSVAKGHEVKLVGRNNSADNAWVVINVTFKSSVTGETVTKDMFCRIGNLTDTKPEVTTTTGAGQG